MDATIPKEMPPSYSSTTSPTRDDLPPAYTFPTSFRIGSKHTENALVTPSQLKSHLALLRAFYGLRQKVEDGGDERLPQAVRETDSKERRWAWFVGLAVERFDMWCRALGRNPQEGYLPPLDVIMVWHAYLLNPGWYAEDSRRIPDVRHLSGLDGIFEWTLFNSGNLWTAEPSDARVWSWFSNTSTAFDPMDAARDLINRTVLCPRCRSTVPAPFTNDSGTGYFQQNFALKCTTCEFVITKDALGVVKFAKDIVRGDGSWYSYLAGTLHTSMNDTDVTRAKWLKAAITSQPLLARPPKASDGVWEKKIGVAVKHSLSKMKLVIGSSMKGGGGRMRDRIMSAYTDDKMYSVDLVGAVLRQSTFVKKMHELGWTEPSFFESTEDEVALQHAVARYHAFLDLLASSPASFFVPTLDIDLAWHTHQLMSTKYNKDCKSFVRRFIDHDDKIEENHLATSFDITCRAWQSRFGVQYMYCGCPLPGETIGQKLSRLVNNNSRQIPSFLQPPGQHDLLAATHPSDHNAVYPFHHKHAAEASRKRRQAKVNARRQRELKGGSAPNKDGYSGHDAAFLLPVPLYYGVPVYGFGGCAAFAGNVVDGNVCGGCAAGAGGCVAGGSGGVGCGGGCGGGGGSCGGGGCGGG